MIHIFRMRLPQWFTNGCPTEDLLNPVDQGASTALRREPSSSRLGDRAHAGYPEFQRQIADLTYQTGSKAAYLPSAAENI